MKTQRCFLLVVTLVVSLLASGLTQAQVGKGGDVAPGEPRGGASVSSAATTVSYVYDAAGRLVQVSYNSGLRITYTYDAAGNLLQRAVSSSASRLYLPVVLRRW